MTFEQLKTQDWIKAIIATCTTEFHLEAAEKLITQYQMQYRDEVGTLALNVYLTEKINELKQIKT